MNAAGCRFTVVIAHRNGAAMLLDTLAHLEHACTRCDEVVVVDNASSDDSIARVKSAHPAVQVIANSHNRGFASACNQGLARGRGRFLMLLNSDAQVAPDLLDRLAARFAEFPRAGLIGAQLVGEDGAAQRSHGVLPRPWDDFVPRPLRARAPRLPGHGVSGVEMLVGACVAVRREVLERVGGLDEDFFFYFEDVEWSARIAAGGWLLLLDQDARVTHRRGAATRAVRRGAQLERFRSRLVYHRKVFSPPLAWLLGAQRLALLAVYLCAALGATAATPGPPPRARPRPAAHLPPPPST